MSVRGKIYPVGMHGMRYFLVYRGPSTVDFDQVVEDVRDFRRVKSAYQREPPVVIAFERLSPGEKVHIGPLVPGPALQRRPSLGLPRQGVRDRLCISIR